MKGYYEIGDVLRLDSGHKYREKFGVLAEVTKGQSHLCHWGYTTDDWDTTTKSIGCIIKLKDSDELKYQKFYFNENVMHELPILEDCYEVIGHIAHKANNKRDLVMSGKAIDEFVTGCKNHPDKTLPIPTLKGTVWHIIRDHKPGYDFLLTSDNESYNQDGDEVYYGYHINGNGEAFYGFDMFNPYVKNPSKEVIFVGYIDPYYLRKYTMNISANKPGFEHTYIHLEDMMLLWAITMNIINR